MRLDANATRPVLAAARAAYFAAERHAHRPARVAEQRAWARRRVAALLGAEPAHVLWVGGASEANAWALVAAWQAAARPRRLVLAATEHPAVAAAARALAAGALGRGRGGRLAWVRPGRDGRLGAGAWARACRGGAALASAALVDGQTGVVQPIAALAAASAGVPLHVDAVQAAGSLPLDLGQLGAHALVVGGHKVGGVGGIAALAYAGPPPPPPPWRPGGEDPELSAAAAVAMAVALAGRLEDARAHRQATAACRDALARALAAHAGPLEVLGAGAPRLPHVLAIRLPGCAADRLVTACDLEGVWVSAGSACHSGQRAPAPALVGLGLGARAAGEVVRLSLPGPLGAAACARAVRVIGRAVARLRAAGGGYGRLGPPSP